jgi:formylglycine-generating enzyme required for sulfatase activity
MSDHPEILVGNPLSSEQTRLLALMLDPQKPPTARAEAGRLINDAGGDPRPGVVNFNWGADYWCKVAAGAFIYQKGQKTEIAYDYWVGKYQITYGQWQTFLDDANGYRNSEWWAGLHARGQAQQQQESGDQYWKFANHPAERVSWYEAMAFCNWLNWRRGQELLAWPSFLPAHYQIRLPTELEWEKAARGTDGHEYPWGKSYKEGFANIDETSNKVGPHYLEMTTAVGIYPQGAAPCAALDMSGNVWEWCFNESGTGKTTTHTHKSRALRGGSWVNQTDEVGAPIRLWINPNLRDWNLGFRLCCSIPMG